MSSSSRRAARRGKSRLGLLAQEVARMAHAILAEYGALQRKLPQARPHAAAYADLQQQLGVLMPKWFVRDTPYAQLAHYPRYLKAAVARIDKLRADPARDARLMGEMAPILTSTSARAARSRRARSAPGRIPLAAGRTAGRPVRPGIAHPMPVSVKRLMKAWESLRR